MFIWAHSILILAQPRPNFPYPYVRINPSHSFSFLISTIHSKSQTLKTHFFSHSAAHSQPPSLLILLIFFSFLFLLLVFLSIYSFFISSSTLPLPSCRQRCCYSHHFQLSLSSLPDYMFSIFIYFITLFYLFIFTFSFLFFLLSFSFMHCHKRVSVFIVTPPGHRLLHLCSWVRR